MRHAMIMAGGAGTRLWPLSRRQRPKQLLPLVEGRSLLAVAVERVASIVPKDGRWICTSEAFRAAIIDSLGFRDDRILGEPVARDTLNAVGFAAAVIASEDPGAVMAVLTADHLIRPVERFAAAIEAGFALAEQEPESLITFSIVPSYPATIYGYIKRGQAIGAVGTASGSEQRAFRVERYVEKPDAATAKQYLDSGGYGWSSGMFVFKAVAMLDAIERFKPETSAGLKRIAGAWTTARRAETLAAVYPTLPKISIDYAIMEPASREPSIPVYTIPMQVEWLDIGSWPSLAETLRPDARGNRSIGPSKLVECSNVFTVTDDGDDHDHHLIAAFGCDDLVIVHTKDATLVAAADRAAEIKAIVESVDERLR